MGVRFDAEALYVAALLHDLGFVHEPETERSFEIVGADLARELINAYDDALASGTWDAIAAHTVSHLARAGRR
jgi:HD superfamily phosphodiesterase